MSILDEVKKLREEAKRLRRENATVKNAWEAQKKSNEKLKKENLELKKKIKFLEALVEKLKSIASKISDYKDTLVGMIFKPNKETGKTKNPNARKRGGQTGHKGAGKESPKNIDQEKESWLTHCPDCHCKLKKSKSFCERTTEDILLPIETIVTRHRVQRQYCPHCKKEVCAAPPGTLPGFRFGINVLIWILIQKYQLRLPLELIAYSFKQQYNLEISIGGIQNILHLLAKRLGTKYQRLAKEIRKGKFKHADETTWRIEGQNVWAWLFATPESVIYTIEETRGKGVPQKILGQNPQGVLIRDDYGGYASLPMEQQSCWAHLLRVARDLARKENASQEMVDLCQTLRAMFKNLSGLNGKPLADKEKEYPAWLKKIQAIINAQYSADNAKKVQTRIANQNVNLLTALKHEGVPLTNNFAEKNIRPLTVIRNISGSSQSNDGGKTLAVNFSVVKTLSLKDRPLVSSLARLLAGGNQKFVLEKTE